jgi:distribution and morphology protein 34
MAFNFNWSPLIADTDRVRDMLTTALNKSPKPPIIVDDILVNELNLGSTPPELEILEIGDLAEDRFRGIFKMSYTGDAYLTLKTRVQANPLNTYLSTKPSFTNPQPLAASSSLTIPLQITLSEIRLSGFVILVFSKQKGITLVFRNDPLESLKVSSTFDAIPFVRDYLQKTIENQLRVLFMEDLPAIIHKLSLRMFNSDYQVADIVQPKKNMADIRAHTDPFASLSSLDEDGSASFTLDPPAETFASFSQKNLLRLAALSESQRTLSLFTPRVRDTVYRAWSNAGERKDAASGTATPTYRTATLSRIHSSLGKTSTASSVASESSGEAGSTASRPTLPSISSTTSLQSLGNSRSRPRQRKRKNRVVDLRKKAVENDSGEVASAAGSYEDSASASGSHSNVLSGSGSQPTSEVLHAERQGEVETPPRSPKKRIGFPPGGKDLQISSDLIDSRPTRPPLTPHQQSFHGLMDDDLTPRASVVLPSRDAEKEPQPQRRHLPRMQTLPKSKSVDLPRSQSEANISKLGASFGEGSTGGILEQAWLMKMAHEIANRVAEEKARGHMWHGTGSDDASGAEAPPAYVS